MAMKTMPAPRPPRNPSELDAVLLARELPEPDDAEVPVVLSAVNAEVPSLPDVSAPAPVSPLGATGADVGGASSAGVGGAVSSRAPTPSLASTMAWTPPSDTVM